MTWMGYSFFAKSLLSVIKDVLFSSVNWSLFLLKKKSKLYPTNEGWHFHQYKAHNYNCKATLELDWLHDQTSFRARRWSRLAKLPAKELARRHLQRTLWRIRKSTQSHQSKTKQGMLDDKLFSQDLSWCLARFLHGKTCDFVFICQLKSFLLKKKSKIYPTNEGWHFRQYKAHN